MILRVCRVYLPAHSDKHIAHGTQLGGGCRKRGIRPHIHAAEHIRGGGAVFFINLAAAFPLGQHARKDLHKIEEHMGRLHSTRPEALIGNKGISLIIFIHLQGLGDASALEDICYSDEEEDWLRRSGGASDGRCLLRDFDLMRMLCSCPATFIARMRRLAAGDQVQIQASQPDPDDLDAEECMTLAPTQADGAGPSSQRGSQKCLAQGGKLCLSWRQTCSMWVG